MQDFCKRIIASAEYRASLFRRIVLGELPSQIEALIWNRAYGEAPKRVEHTGANGGPIPVTVVRSVVVHATQPLALEAPLDEEVARGVH